jgi:hypothetical protein
LPGPSPWAGQNRLASQALVEKGIDPLFWSAGPKGSGGSDCFSWVGRVDCGPSPVAQCCLLFSIRIIQINLIQIWFEFWKFVET